ncbi:exodeoxyribonuclease III [Thiorhodovibrio frisius]|uniref:Exodeoxyribonuclease III n=1 Tax=Thiorhodovibrio frisius TaxID=631362 RepID=H8Z160_9GAMM|nr:exodeoxyribonuclease III [Thiorhodovibrio frisius]EIC21375.1 exodeoxyribonuclease III [Thiorhodovibrio frisius]WPL23961.1 Exodeoxyribonuclease III [Thiorhodovibrio frisius]
MTVLTSFNINGIRARPHQLQAIKDLLAPDIIGLQESKVVDEQFPREMIEALGYHPAYHGQKGHYGVALLSKEPPKRLHKGFPGDDADAQRRAITGVFTLSDGSELHVINGYFPQGESRAHPVKFPYKQRFYANLLDYLRRDFTPDQQILVMGDMNVAPLDLDIGIGENNAKRWLRSGKCSFLPEEREWFSALTAWGLHDSFRLLHPDTDNRFSWFDYRSRGFEDNPKRGLRIDLMLISTPLRERLRGAGIDYDIRALEKPSDHCPVWIDLE